MECKVTVKQKVELNSVETIIAVVRQVFGVSIVPKLPNVRGSRDRALRIARLLRLTVVRRVGLLERPQHTQTRFTAAIKGYFAATRTRARR